MQALKEARFKTITPNQGIGAACQSFVTSNTMMDETDHMVDDVDFMDSEPTSKEKIEVRWKWHCQC